MRRSHAGQWITLTGFEEEEEVWGERKIFACWKTYVNKEEELGEGSILGNFCEQWHLNPIFIVLVATGL